MRRILARLFHASCCNRRTAELEEVPPKALSSSWPELNPPALGYATKNNMSSDRETATMLWRKVTSPKSWRGPVGVKVSPAALHRRPTRSHGRAGYRIHSVSILLGLQFAYGRNDLLFLGGGISLLEVLNRAQDINVLSVLARLQALDQNCFHGGDERTS
jgi:hypothetical protein